MTELAWFLTTIGLCVGVLCTLGAIREARRSARRRERLSLEPTRRPPSMWRGR